MRVLVLCHGNRYRSPVAAALLASLNPEWAIDSAACKLSSVGYPAGVPAREVAARWGLDLSRHRSKAVTPELIAWADTVLYMDGGNARRLSAMFGMDPKFICLGTYAGVSRIPDPNYLKGEPREAVWALIRRACDEFPRT